MPHGFNQVLAGHLVIDAEHEPSHRPVGLPLQLAGPAGDRGLDLGIAFRVEIGDGVAVRMCRDHLGLQHASGVRTDRKERAVGGASLFAKGGQHDVHDLVIARQNRAQTVIEPARSVTVGRADEFIVEAETVEEGLQAGIVVRTK